MTFNSILLVQLDMSKRGVAFRLSLTWRLVAGAAFKFNGFLPSNSAWDKPEGTAKISESSDHDRYCLANNSSE
jgi:hypothetical protein